MCQRNPEDDAPTIESLYDYGTIADVIKIFDLPDGGHTTIIRARDKFHILDSAENNTAGGNALAAKVEIVGMLSRAVMTRILSPLFRP